MAFTFAVERYRAPASTSAFIRSMPSAHAASLVSQRRWPWMVTSRGAASWKSPSNVVFVDGTSTPMRFRAVMVVRAAARSTREASLREGPPSVEAQRIALGPNGLHRLEPVLGHVAVELDAIAVGIREVHAVRDVVGDRGLD